MNRIEIKFKELRRKKKKAFIAFITAGYPSLAVTEKLIYEFDRIGVDVLELGVPFTDPMADGPVIQEASQVALKKSVRLIDILRLVKKVRASVKIPICLMTYYNPIFCFPEEKFINMAYACGVDGIIIPDLSAEEGEGFMRRAHKQRLDVISFISPTTSRERIKYIASGAKGFIYYVSLTGVTGARNRLPVGLKEQMTAIKKITSKPICVGFGISTPAQVKGVYRISDGVIVGSAIVKKIKAHQGEAGLVKRVGRFVSDLRGNKGV